MPTKLSKKLYRVQVYIGTENGKRIYKSFYGETKKEAEYQALVYKMSAGKEIKKGAITLRAAIEAYIQSKEAILSPTTIDGYKKIVRNLDADFLAVNIYSITRLSLQNEINKMAARDKFVLHNGSGSLSPKTIRNSYGLIAAALRQHDIKIDGITLPKKKKIEYATPFENELTEVFRAVAGTKIEIPVLLAACCSLRKSEIMGLRYGDIENGIIHVRRARVRVGDQYYIKDTKTYSSTRDIYLPRYIEDKINSARGNKTDDDFVADISANTLNGYFHRRLEAAGVKPCRFHDLRHSFVSILAANGVDPKWIQEQGGWSTDGVMNGVYRQSDPTISAAISARVNGIFEGIVKNVQQ